MRVYTVLHISELNFSRYLKHKFCDFQCSNHYFSEKCEKFSCALFHVSLTLRLWYHTEITILNNNYSFHEFTLVRSGEFFRSLSSFMTAFLVFHPFFLLHQIILLLQNATMSRRRRRKNKRNVSNSYFKSYLYSFVCHLIF